MNRFLLVGALVAAGILAGISMPTTKSAAQTGTITAQCVAHIPTQWGTFTGASGAYGLSFEDSSGTIRFVKQIPCGGLEGVPMVALEIRRK